MYSKLMETWVNLYKFIFLFHMKTGNNSLIDTKKA